jgi:hypothetical protein
LSTGQTPNRRVSSSYYFRGRSAYHYYYRIPQKIRLPLLLTNTAEEPATITTSTTTTTFIIEIIFAFRAEKLREVSFQELIILYEEYPLPQLHIRHIVITKDNIIVLDP